MATGWYVYVPGCKYVCLLQMYSYAFTCFHESWWSNHLQAFRINMCAPQPTYRRGNSAIKQRMKRFHESPTRRWRASEQQLLMNPRHPSPVISIIMWATPRQKIVFKINLLHRMTEPFWCFLGQEKSCFCLFHARKNRVHFSVNRPRLSLSNIWLLLKPSSARAE